MNGARLSLQSSPLPASLNAHTFTHTHWHTLTHTSPFQTLSLFTSADRDGHQKVPKVPQTAEARSHWTQESLECAKKSLGGWLLRRLLISLEKTWLLE